MKLKIVKRTVSADIVKCEKGYSFIIDGYDEPEIFYNTQQEALDACYLKQAYDAFGSAIRDNTKEFKIELGKGLDDGSVNLDDY